MIAVFVFGITAYGDKAPFSVHQCDNGKQFYALRLPLALLIRVWYTFFKCMVHILK